ncbi:MAG: hypothetical protein AB1657_03990 [Candidatus Micrarchaeota archaeon]
MKFSIGRNVHVPAFTAERKEGADKLFHSLRAMKRVVERPVRAGRLLRRMAYAPEQSVTYLRRIAEMAEREGRHAYHNMMVEAGGSLVPALRMGPRLMAAIKGMDEPDSGSVMGDAEYLRRKGLRFAYNESLLLAMPLLRAARKFEMKDGGAYIMPGSMPVTRILVLNFSQELLELMVGREARAEVECSGIPEEAARRSLMAWWEMRTGNWNRRMV